MTADADPATLRDLAVACATEAGDLLADALHEARTTVASKSSATDMVTEMDAASERLLEARLMAARPDDTIVGEEGAHRAGTSGVRWVVDPLDGTTNYLYRMPGWNVSVGAEIGGTPVAGAVVIPGYGDTFAAATGLGATHNGVSIAVADAPPLERALVGTGFAYDPDTRAVQGAVVSRLLPRVRDVRRVGAAAGDLCAVACGRLDGYYESGLAPWDECAGTVIAREAGARVERLAGTPLPEPVTVAAPPALWDDLLDVLRTAGALHPDPTESS
ncbi:MAG: inositol monophosphatase family protein [Acidimicrobiales bacterium]|nr:inositol monophosphatase family protein [Acidimicrobiales bacterium]